MGGLLEPRELEASLDNVVRLCFIKNTKRQKKKPFFQKGIDTTGTQSCVLGQARWPALLVLTRKSI
jgi:hypothetical protein